MLPRGWILVALGSILFALAGCSSPASMLEPSGPAAAQIANLWWVYLILGVLVWVIVLALILVALFHIRRPDEPSPETSSRFGGDTPIILGGVALPAVVLVALFLFTIGTLRALPTVQPNTLNIEVTGLQWWWRVHYPDGRVTTANEIHIPVGRTVQLLLNSDDVIHSFWVPRLHGKVDMIPGKTNTLVLQADTLGEYVGECAEFCGTQHARMHLRLIAMPPDEFDAWLDAQSRPAPDPANSTLREGQQIFLGSACVYCHTIRGTNASGVLGPDLTHLASRRTLAAGVVPNTGGYLTGWIADPHGIKPGNRMPPTLMDADDLNLLVTYLESLE